MQLKIDELHAETSAIEGLKVIQVKCVTDDRGTVRELYRESRYDFLPEQLPAWKQVNLTKTQRGAVRGLHGEAMSKLVTVACGSAFGAYVDTRVESPTFGAVVTVTLVPGVQVFVPQGVCNGFQALESDTEYLYFFDQEWVSGMSGTALCPLDPMLKIKWPIPIDPNNRQQISEKDASAPSLQKLKETLR